MPVTMRNCLNVNMPSAVSLPAARQEFPERFEQFGTLYKHCNPEFLPRPGRMLKLGSLSGYRNAENRFLRDKAEGLFQVALNFPQPVVIPMAWLRQVTYETCYLTEGHYQSNLIIRQFAGWRTGGIIWSNSNLGISNLNPRAITIAGVLDILFEGADAFLLCLSKNEEPYSTIKDPAFNSVWSIKRGSVMDFAHSVAKLLHEKIIYNGLPLRAGDGRRDVPFASPQDVGNYVDCIIFEIYGVDYRNKTMNVFSADWSVVNDVYLAIDNSFAIKPVEFSQECEVRIMFRPVRYKIDEERFFLFPHYLGDVFLPFDSLLKYCSV